MASSPTSRLRLMKQATYDNPDSWGVELNQGALDMLDEAWGRSAITVGSDVSLDAQNYITDEARRFILHASGAGGFTITTPAVDKPYWVINECAANITVKPAGGTGAVIRAGTSAMWYTDGTTGYVSDPTLDKIKLPEADVSLNGQKLVDVGEPTDPTDAATKGYIDTLAASSDLGTVAAIADEIRTLADIQDGTVATDTLTDLAAVAGDVALLGPISTDITQLAGMFCGAAAANPTTRLDGSALQAGDYYLDTSVIPTVNIYDGSAWNAVLVLSLASQPEAEAGTNNTKAMTPLRTAQAVTARSGSQIFAASGMFSKVPNATWYLVEAWGAGGGGGRGTSTTTSGGAGGGYSHKIIHAGDLAASTAVTIGAGGAGANPGGLTGGHGSAGGDTAFGAHLTAKGGHPGKNGTQELALPGGSSAAVAASAQGVTIRVMPINPNAGYGDFSANAGGSTISGGGGGGGANGGVGGTSLLGGNGGPGVNDGNAGDGAAPGGGGGGNGVGTSGSRAGNGARGEVRVYWW